MNTGVFNRIGPYEIDREIGRGGMAVVFLARDTRTNVDVALKQVPAGPDREAREIYEAEQWGAKLQEQFSTASDLVPKVYEHRTIGDHFYVAMEYVEGENLSDAIARGPMPVDRAVGIAAELAKFLHAAHHFEVTLGDRNLRALLHGDLKPKNIRITPEGRVKVLDFGIAKALSMTRRVTRNDFGSIAYLSPERLESGEIDEASDLWAVGVLLYEMLTGVPPFRGADTRRVEDRIKSRRPPEPVDPAVPVAVRAILAKALAADMAARYLTASAIIDDLSRFTAGRETEAEREGWVLRIDDESPTRSTRPPAAADEPATKRTRPEPAVAAARPAVPVPPSPPAAAAVPPRRPRLPRRLATFGLVFVVFAIGKEGCIGAQADRVAGTVAVQELSELSDAWERRDSLVRRSWLGGMGVGDLDRALVSQSRILADRVIENYRLPKPTVREAQWSAARANLARAIAVRPDDRLKAALRYCDGHLHRINAEARKKRGEIESAQQAFTDAVAAFREAADLRRDWPDPFLGLARTFIGMQELDRGTDAFQRAEQLGYTLGDREAVLLADGYGERGDTLWRTAATLRGMSQEEDHLNRSTEAYREAMTLYSKIADFTDTAASIRRIDRRLKQIDDRLTEIRGRKWFGLPWR
jgi:serine/threonine protein kinase